MIYYSCPCTSGASICEHLTPSRLANPFTAMALQRGGYLILGRNGIVYANDTIKRTKYNLFLLVFFHVFTKPWDLFENHEDIYRTRQRVRRISRRSNTAVPWEYDILWTWCLTNVIFCKHDIQRQRQRAYYYIFIRRLLSYIIFFIALHRYDLVCLSIFLDLEFYLELELYPESTPLGYEDPPKIYWRLGVCSATWS